MSLDLYQYVADICKALYRTFSRPIQILICIVVTKISLKKYLEFVKIVEGKN